MDQRKPVSQMPEMRGIETVLKRGVVFQHGNSYFTLANLTDTRATLRWCNHRGDVLRKVPDAEITNAEFDAISKGK